ncbi:MAG: methionine sulfoxide reductase [Bacteroidetes bacterium GWF2_38_335]|nr:MAG: methionine sulfoxide reductase [Bacteroidetes bacterium GWF2_38_335]OFY77728.1 MAG: methionine sulfoxide reductase [Bacteroidetes bacterium RIFOXYA12_FULL_38_20]HBS89083.1 methionine sulfoxide reductase [Bacteroidales bacterium]
MEKNKLTEAEKRVIIGKGTEPAFAGVYTDNFEKGTYVCKNCDAPLYNSSDKFHSGCGWPAFDDEIEGAVKRIQDADGRRTEIVCAACNGHLGHVFEGEGFTPKDTRHCVNSISMKFIPDSEKTETAVFAGGCFWGVEYYFLNLKGVVSTMPGYTGGHKKNPTYEEVCSGSTGHIEAVEIKFMPDEVSYEELAKLFFEIHDPTQENGQGPDIGEQYLSVVFYQNEQQKEITEKLISQLEKKGYDVATGLLPADKFWPAEDYHRKYYEKKGKKPYCHIRTSRF